MVTDLIIRLAHELSCALEMNVPPQEIASPVWGDAIDAISEARHHLVDNNLTIPEPIDVVLAMADRAP